MRTGCEVWTQDPLMSVMRSVLHLPRGAMAFRALAPAPLPGSRRGGRNQTAPRQSMTGTLYLCNPHHIFSHAHSLQQSLHSFRKQSSGYNWKICVALSYTNHKIIPCDRGNVPIMNPLQRALRPASRRVLASRRPIVAATANSGVQARWQQHNGGPIDPVADGEMAVGELEGAKFKIEPLRRTGEDAQTMRARLTCTLLLPPPSLLLPTLSTSTLPLHSSLFPIQENTRGRPDRQ